jgi:hypothetical protein
MVSYVNRSWGLAMSFTPNTEGARHPQSESGVGQCSYLVFRNHHLSGGKYVSCSNKTYLHNLHIFGNIGAPEILKVVRYNPLTPYIFVNHWGKCSCLRNAKLTKLTGKGWYFSYANYPLIICNFGKSLIRDWPPLIQTLQSWYLVHENWSTHYKVTTFCDKRMVLLDQLTYRTPYQD